MTPNYTKHDTCVIVDNFVEMGDFSKNYPFLFVDRKMEKDVEYVENLTFAMDLKVLWMTVKTVLGHSEEVAEDTNAVEGNFAEIRKKRLEETGSLEKQEAAL